MSSGLSQRAASSPITDHRRMAFFANSTDSFSKSLYSGLPVPNVNFMITHNGVQQMRCISAYRIRH
jgi:hypothetical protein